MSKGITYQGVLSRLREDSFPLVIGKDLKLGWYLIQPGTTCKTYVGCHDIWEICWPLPNGKTLQVTDEEKAILKFTPRM